MELKPKLLKQTNPALTPSRPTRGVADEAAPITFGSFVSMLGGQIGRELDGKSGLLAIDFNGVDFVVAHDPDTWGADQVAFVCDFGVVPEDDRCAILERVLMSNMDAHGMWSPVFALRPRNGHLVSITVLPLELLDAEMTMQVLIHYTVAVDRWHAHHFLDAVG